MSEPTDPQPRLMRAELYRHHGRFADALSDLEAASLISPELRTVNYLRGLIYLDAGHYAEAEAVLRKFLASEPVHPAGHEARARALLQLGHPLDAAREYDLAIEQQPVPIPDHYYERASAYGAAGDEHLEQAIRGIDAGIAVMGPISGLERVAIDLELRRGDTDAALARLGRITQRSPRREAWLARRGEILIQAGRPDEAKQSFALALAA
ncbi:MAG: tetratricopeptide repeat protein, partial [Myxococcota bacterium]